MAEREAITRLTVKGADQAAGDLKKVTEAQRDQAAAAKEQETATGAAGGAGTAAGAAAVAAATRETAEATTEAAKATPEYSGNAANLAAVLTAVHPALGGLVTVLENALKLTGDLGTAKLDLGKIIDVVTKSVQGNAAAYLVLGAGGAAFAAISAAVGQWKELRQEAAAAVTAVQQYIDLQSQLSGAREDVRAQLADALIQRGQPSPEALDEAMTREQQIRRAGLGGVSVQAAAAGAGRGAGAGDFLALAAAMERGYIDPTETDPLGALQKVRQDRRRAGELEQVVSLLGQEQDRRDAEGREQFHDFTWKTGKGWPFWPFYSRDKLFAFGENDEILRLIEQKHGLTGEPAKQALAVARQRMALHRATQRAKQGEFMFAPFQGWAGEEAYELPDEQGDMHRVGPTVAEIGDALFEEFRRDDGQAPSRAQENVRVIHHHDNRNIEYHPTHYHDRRRGFNTRTRRSERDRAGIG